MVLGRAEGILQGKLRTYTGESNREVELTAQIFEACDEFDEAVEFAAYDRTSVPGAIAEFFREAAARYEETILDSLRQVTSAKSRLAQVGRLPVLPAAATKLMRTSAESVSVAELESIAVSDPVLTGRLLGAANSAYFGSRSEIRHLRQAIMRVGITFARKALLSACFGSLFASSALRDLWTHSKMVAATAHELAGHIGFDRDVAYIAGLLHDIGRLVTQSGTAETRVEEDNLLQAGFPLVYAETLIYGADHAAVGGDLLSSWSLPDEIAEAITCHHRPEATDSVLAGLIYLAEDHCGSGSLVSENLSPAMRRAAAVQTTGIHSGSRVEIDRRSAIFAIAG